MIYHRKVTIFCYVPCPKHIAILDKIYKDKNKKTTKLKSKKNVSVDPKLNRNKIDRESWSHWPGSSRS